MSFLRNSEFWGAAVAASLLLAIPIGCQIIINNQKQEAAKPKKMAPCSSVLDACYKDPTPGIGDAAWYIKQEDRFIKSGLSRD
jgi:hypothetical protein